MIRQTGDIIRDVVARGGGPGDFIGHIAGDDFVFITERRSRRRRVPRDLRALRSADPALLQPGRSRARLHRDQRSLRRAAPVPDHERVDRRDLARAREDLRRPRRARRRRQAHREGHPRLEPTCATARRWPATSTSTRAGHSRRRAERQSAPSCDQLVGIERSPVRTTVDRSPSARASVDRGANSRRRRAARPSARRSSRQMRHRRRARGDRTRLDRSRSVRARCARDRGGVRAVALDASTHVASADARRRGDSDRARSAREDDAPSVVRSLGGRERARARRPGPSWLARQPTCVAPRGGERDESRRPAHRCARCRGRSNAISEPGRPTRLRGRRGDAAARQHARDRRASMPRTRAASVWFPASRAGRRPRARRARSPSDRSPAVRHASATLARDRGPSRCSAA